MVKHRPFFSIVIACYNPSKYLPTALLSVVQQHLPEDIEVILSDDHSTENYDDIVEMFSKYIHIKRTITDYNFAPGNTREKGTEIATGQWLMFLDQDDQLYPDTLVQVMATIQNEGEQIYAVSDFNEVYPDGSICREFRANLSWCHGKFYNLDNMWKFFDMHFKKDFPSHEDIYICSMSNCIMRLLNDRQPLYVPVVTYRWNVNNESLTHSKFVAEAGSHNYLESLFRDYLESTAYVYYRQYALGNIDKEYAFSSMVEVLCYCYFYMQGFKFHDPEGYIKKNVDYCVELLKGIKLSFGITNKDIYNLLAANDAEAYMFIRKSAEVGSGPCIYSETLMQWLDSLWSDDLPIEDSFTIEYPSSRETITSQH